MPLTSYALKTLGSSTALMLTVGLATAALVSVAEAAAPSPPPNPFALIEVAPRDPANSSPHVVLARVDPVTLQPTSPTLDLGRTWPDPQATVVRSPDGNRAIVQIATRLLVINVQTMRRIATLRAVGRPLAWPTRRRLVVVDQAKVAIVDPVTSNVVATHDFRLWGRGAGGVFHVQFARGQAVVLAGAYGTPLRLARIGPGRRKDVVVRSIWLGLEPRRAGSRDPLPSGARKALEETRAAVARSENVPVSAVQSVAVTPGDFPTTAYGCPRRVGNHAITRGYQVIVAVGGRTHDYRASVDGGEPFFCQHDAVPSARNLLRAPRSANHVRAAALAADPTGRAFVIAAEGLVAEVSPEGQKVRLRRLDTELPRGSFPRASWVGKGQLVYGPAFPRADRIDLSSAAQIDLRTGKVQVIGSRCLVTPRIGLILVHSGFCRGLEGRAPSGRRRFRLFAQGPAVHELYRTKRHAYIRFHDGSPFDAPRKTLHVVDLSRGVVVGQVDVGGSTRVITE